MPKIILGYLMFLASFLILINQTYSQTLAPDHYYDFTKVYSYNQYDWVYDQITQDDLQNFGSIPDRGVCVDEPSTQPLRGPDGMQFSSYRDSLRLENSNNMMMTNKYQIAIWVKILPQQVYRYDKFFTQKRYDQSDNPKIMIGLYTDSNDGLLYFQFRTELQTYYSPYSTQSYLKTLRGNVDPSLGGWHLISVALDSSSGTKTIISMRIRGPGPAFKYDNYIETVTNLVYQDTFALSSKMDTYIGGYCEASWKRYRDGGFFTIGKLYIWQNFANTASDLQFDKYFFKQNGAIQPKCQGIEPCLSCAVSYPLPITTTSNLNCSTISASTSDLLILHWNFDDDTTSPQYILDQSGNGIHLQKNPVNDNEQGEVMRIFGQGYLFYGYNILQSVKFVQFNKYKQFTVEVWMRKITDSFSYNPALTQGAVPFYITDITGANGLMGFQIIDNPGNNQVRFFYENNSKTVYFQNNNYFLTDQWHFFSMSANTAYTNTNNWSIHCRFQVDQTVAFQTNSANSNNPFFTNNDGQIRITGYRSYIYKSVKIYSYAKYEDEMNSAASSSCTAVGTQFVCPICPGSNQKCLSKCEQAQYGDNCDTCHSFCGHCTGPTKNDCVYCSRTVTPANVFYSKTFGNCTCIPGYYYDSTSNSCKTCHANCQECFGATAGQCLSCKTGKIFYETSNCVDNCDDPLVVQGTILGFYKQTETVLTKTFELCIKCHPYCAKCTGGSNTQCQSCQAGFFLVGTSTCSDVCTAGQWPNQLTRKCEACHADCKTCTGPSNSECLSCNDPTKFQQSGSCVNKCNNGYYPDSIKVCQVCHDYCATCNSKLSTDCSACNPGYYLEWLGFTCGLTCKLGQYKDDNTNQCSLCHYTCETCSAVGADKCTKCAKGFLKRGSYCVDKCADNEYEVNGECKSCDYRCSSCYGTQNNQCYTCAENTITGQGYYYFDDTCLEKCPDGYYQDNLLRACRKCNPRCATCISSTYCTSCIYGPFQLNNGECTYFTCLDTQYRAIRPQLSCFECDSTCLTCQGESSFDCLSCRPKDQFVAQQCLSCKEQPGMTDPTDDSIKGCVEICGDGFNYGSFQCDDGNILNGDGCSSKCVIEDGFNCTTGTKLTPSVCMDNKNPTPKITLISSKNLIYIQFDEEVSLQKTLDTTTLSVTVQGPASSYKFDWRLLDEYKTAEPVQMIVLQLEFYSSLKGSEKEQVWIEFMSSDIYKDGTGNGIVRAPLKGFLSKYEYIDPETKAKLDAAGDTSMLATFGAVAINLVISQLFGGSIAAMWTMVNTIQLISLLPLSAVKYPQITVLVFEKMLASHGESTIIPNVFYTFLINRSGSSVVIEPALNDRFSDYGWEISNFLYLSGRKILLWTLIILAYPVVYYMKKNYADKHKLCRLWIKAEQKFRYTLLLRGVIMSYVSMYLAFVLGIFKMNLTTMENTISAFFAIAFGILLTYLPILILNILQRNYEKVQTEKFMLSYSTIVKEVDLSHPIRYMYYPVFLMRRALFAIMLVLFANQPIYQIICMSVTALVMIIYVVVIKPQKEKIMIILTSLGEIVLLFLHMFSYVFIDENLPEEKANQYGYLILVVVGLYILANWVVIITITVKQMKQKWRDFKQGRVDRVEKMKEEQQYQKWKKKRHLKRQIEHEAERQHMIQALDNERSQLLNVPNQHSPNMNINSLPHYEALHQNNIQTTLDNQYSPAMGPKGEFGFDILSINKYNSDKAKQNNNSNYLGVGDNKFQSSYSPNNSARSKTKRDRYQNSQKSSHEELTDNNMLNHQNTYDHQTTRVADGMNEPHNLDDDRLNHPSLATNMRGFKNKNQSSNGSSSNKLLNNFNDAIPEEDQEDEINQEEQLSNFGRSFRSQIQPQSTFLSQHRQNQELDSILGNNKANSHEEYSPNDTPREDLGSTSKSFLKDLKESEERQNSIKPQQNQQQNQQNHKKQSIPIQIVDEEGNEVSANRGQRDKFADLDDELLNNQVI
eukprot:403376857